MRAFTESERVRNWADAQLDLEKGGGAPS